MDLYILRHGIAEDGRPNLTDAKRQLTPEGVRKLERVLRNAAKIGVEPDLILTSPLTRAVQTAEAAAKVLRCASNIVRTRSLLPEARPEDTWTELRKHSGARAVIVTGHQPHLGAFLSALLGSTRETVDLKKGALARVSIEKLGLKPAGVLHWLITPGTTR